VFFISTSFIDFSIFIIDNGNRKGGCFMNTDFSALSHIDWERFMPLLLIYISINLILLSCACIDWFRRKDRIATPAIWLMVILLVQPIGSILYFVIGRRTTA